MDNKIYDVYMHTFPNGKRYIGITSYGSVERWHNGHGYKRQTMMWRAIQKYGWKNISHEILYTNLSKEKAERKEIELIKKYKSDQRQYGYNIKHGGNINGGYKLSKEAGKKMSISRSGEKNWIYGKHLSEETKKKLSEAHKGRKADKNAIQRGAQKRMGANAHNARKVDRYDLEWNFIKTYDSLADGGRETNTRPQDIYNCCIGRQSKTHGNIWRYHEGGVEN